MVHGARWPRFDQARRGLRLCAWVIFITSSAPSHAAPTPGALTEVQAREQARSLSQRARAHRQAGDDAGALALYQQAYELYPSPFLAWPLAELYLATRALDRAEELLDEHARSFAGSKYPEGQGEAEIAALRARIAEARRPPPPPPPPVVVVAPPPPPPPAPRPRLGPWKWALSASGLALAGAGAALLAVNRRRGDECWAPGDLRSCAVLLDTSAPGGVALGLGGAALVGGAILFVLDARLGRREPPRLARASW